MPVEVGSPGAMRRPGSGSRPEPADELAHGFGGGFGDREHGQGLLPKEGVYNGYPSCALLNA